MSLLADYTTYADRLAFLQRNEGIERVFCPDCILYRLDVDTPGKVGGRRKRCQYCAGTHQRDYTRGWNCAHSRLKTLEGHIASAREALSMGWAVDNPNGPAAVAHRADLESLLREEAGLLALTDYAAYGRDIRLRNEAKREAKKAAAERAAPDGSYPTRDEMIQAFGLDQKDSD